MQNDNVATNNDPYASPFERGPETKDPHAKSGNADTSSKKSKRELASDKDTEANDIFMKGQAEKLALAKKYGMKGAPGAGGESSKLSNLPGY